MFNGFIRPPGTRNALLAAILAMLSLGLSCGGCNSNTSSSGPAFSNSSLNGNYTYTLSGNYYNSAGGSGPYQEAGTFVADGNGNITAGVDDLVQNSTHSSGPLTGSYAISADGTGTAKLNLARGTVTLALTLVSSTSFYLIEFDSSASGDGEALQQLPSAFSAAPSGTFAFRLHSTLANSAAITAVASVGQMILQNGSITGSQDSVRAGVPLQSTITGSITSPDENGRGKAVITDDVGNVSDYTFYVVDRNTLKFLEIDPDSPGGGRADAQSGGPFSNASLGSGFSFRGRGDTLTNAFGANSIGVFVGDGNGNILSGSYDAVQDGNPLESASLAGNYYVGSNGRATITLTPEGLSPIPLIVWMVNSSYGFLLVNAPDLAEDGRLDQQQKGAFSAASLNGRYAFYEFGSQSQTSPWLVRVGVMTFDGKGTITFSDYFSNKTGSTVQRGPVSGSYSVSPNGRVTAFSVGAVNEQVIYLLSPNSGSLILSAARSELAGSLALQALP